MRKGEGVLQLKTGIYVPSLGLPFRRALERAAALGADAVEIDAQRDLNVHELSQTGVREIRKMLEDHRLKICAMRFQTRHGYEVADELDRRIAMTQRVLSAAYKLGAPVVVVLVGQTPESEQAAAWTLLVDSLSDLGRHAQQVGATLCARTGAEPGEDLARLIRALPDGTLGVAFDPGMLILNGHSPRVALASLGPYVQHAYARDAVRDVLLGRGLETPLGEGAADFPTLLGMLEEQQYRGYLTIECAPSRAAEAHIRAALDYLQKLFV